MQKEEEDVDDSAKEERQDAECLAEIDLLKNEADGMDEDIVVDFLKNDDGFEFGNVDTDV